MFLLRLAKNLHIINSKKYIDNKISNSSNVNISPLPKKKTKFLDKIKYALEYPIRVQEEYERLKSEIKELEKHPNKE